VPGGGNGGAPGANNGANGQNTSGSGGGGGGGTGTLVARTRSTVELATSSYDQLFALGHRFDDCCGSGASFDAQWSWVLSRKYHAAPPSATASNVEQVGP
jgi:hypothetical protein